MKKSFFFTLLFAILFVTTHSKSQIFTKWSASTSAASNSYYIGDFNGDENSDITYYDGYYWYRMYSNGQNGFTDEIYGSASGQGTDNGVYVGDFNGDGISDKITKRLGPQYINWQLARNRRYVDQPNYWFNDEQKITDGQLISADQDLNTIGDFNGDGMSDLIYIDGSNAILNLTYFDSNGDLQWNKVTWTLPNLPTNYLRKIIAGNFFSDGDVQNGQDLGYTDLAIISYSDPTTYYGSNFQLTFYQSNGSQFIYKYQYTITDPTDIRYLLVGDFNGDGMDEIAYNTNNQWEILTNFDSSPYPNLFASNSPINNGTWAGDFNGDGVTDLITLKSDGWYVRLSLPPIVDGKRQDHLVGGAIYLTYRIPQPNTSSGWFADNNNCKINPNIYPIAGWGSTSADTSVGYYSDNDISVIKKQLSAMKKAGFDFVIANNTDGLNPLNPKIGDPNSGYPGDYTCKEPLRNLFTAASEVGIKVVVALGAEFWGPAAIVPPGWTWDSWGASKLRVKNAVDTLKVLVQEFPNTYFHYRGKPLLIAYVANGYDYPPGFYEGNNLSRWYIPGFTVRYSVGYYSTFSRNVNLDSFSGTNNYGNIVDYCEGIDKKRFWGWDEGNRDDEQGKLPDLIPFDAECMSVMPGTTMWWDTLGVIIDRRGGDFYRESWDRVLQCSPEVVIMPEINNWNEECGIEGCKGKTNPSQGYTDRYGNATYDWYWQMTQKYISAYKSSTIPPDTYYKLDNDLSTIYYRDLNNIDHIVANYPSYIADILVPRLLLAKISVGSDNKLMKKEDLNFTSYPNPFNPTVSFVFNLPSDGNTKIEVYDILGRLITTLINNKLGSGNHKIEWTPTELASGIYISKLTWNNETLINKIIFMK